MTEAMFAAIEGMRDESPLVQAIANALEEQDAIPAIREHMVLIQSIAGEDWWVGVLNEIRQRAVG